MAKTTKITEDWVELTPAYGRDYRKGADAIRDFIEGKDWVLNMPGQGTYCSIRATSLRASTSSSATANRWRLSPSS